jgi:hypothetical protein
VVVFPESGAAPGLWEAGKHAGDNAGVVQCFGARNRRRAQEFASLVGGVDADTVMKLSPREQLVLIEGGEPVRCRQVRYFEDEEFRAMWTGQSELSR